MQQDDWEAEGSTWLVKTKMSSSDFAVPQSARISPGTLVPHPNLRLCGRVLSPGCAPTPRGAADAT